MLTGKNDMVISRDIERMCLIKVHDKNSHHTGN